LEVRKVATKQERKRNGREYPILVSRKVLLNKRIAGKLKKGGGTRVRRGEREEARN